MIIVIQYQIEVNRLKLQQNIAPYLLLTYPIYPRDSAIEDGIFGNNDISWNALFSFAISFINFDLCQIRHTRSSLEFAVRFPPTPSGDFLCFA